MGMDIDYKKEQKRNFLDSQMTNQKMKNARGDS